MEYIDQRIHNNCIISYEILNHQWQKFSSKAFTITKVTQYFFLLFHVPVWEYSIDLKGGTCLGIKTVLVVILCFLRIVSSNIRYPCTNKSNCILHQTMNRKFKKKKKNYTFCIENKYEGSLKRNDKPVTHRMNVKLVIILTMNMCN